MVEAREMGRLWRSDRRGDGVGQRDGAVVDIREMVGCGDQRKGRCWRSERLDGCGD